MQDFVQKLRERGELYEGVYSGFYCSSCEQFYVEEDLVQPGNLCPIHKRPIDWLEETNWFFPLKKWAPRLLELYDGNPDFVRPAARFNEARSLIAGGLEDVSFSRATVSWGMPLPWDPAQTIYVWVDALLNYRTALEYGLGRDVTGEFWPTTLHVMAKDILRLHGIIWPAMLMAAGYEPPEGLFVHGFFTFDGHKMSKTLGNVIDPFEVVDLLGADALRFYLMREIQFGQDGDVSWEGLHRRYEGELANDLGNLISRATNMIGRYRDGRVPAGNERARTGGRCGHGAARRDRRHRRAGADLDARAGRQPVRGGARARGRLRSPTTRPTPSSSTRRSTRSPTRCAASACCSRPTSPGPPAAMLEAVGDPGATRLGSGGPQPAARRGGRHPAAAALPARRRGMIDTHAHLDACREPAEDLVAEAAAAGVERILTVGREQAIDLAERFDGVSAIVGWHPHEAEVVGDPAAIEPLLAHPSVVAVGECGLDYYRDYAPRDDQMRVFRAQVEIANRVGKPLVIHTREADADTFAVLEDARVRVVLHCFSSVDLTDEAIERGYLFSFAGNVTYPAPSRCARLPRGSRPTGSWPRPTARTWGPCPIAGSPTGRPT